MTNIILKVTNLWLTITQLTTWSRSMRQQ